MNLEHERPRINLESLKTQKNCLFHAIYIPFMQRFNKYMAFVALLLGMLGVAGLSNFSELTKPEEFLPSDHMLQIFSDTIGDKWIAGADTEYIPLDIYWGVAGIERNIWGWYTGNESRYGDTLILDDDFDLSDPAAQAAIQELCDSLLNEPCEVTGCQGLGTLILQSADFECPIVDFLDWWNTTFGNTDYAKVDKNITEKDEFFARLKTFAITENKLDFIGFIDDKLRYLGTRWRLTANPFAPAFELNPVEDVLQSLIDEYNANAPSTAKNARFSSNEFVQIAVEEALFSTTLRGLLITFPIVFIVLLFATGNYLLTLFSGLSIFFIVMVVLGTVFTILGWELGIAESIVSIMIVGLSVDYTVHLGHMYTSGGRDEALETRDERYKYAALTMGMTVIAGGATTLGAGAFLFGTQITFFQKMAVLLTLTVLLSLFYSFFFMLALASWIGPEKDYADTCKSSNSNRDKNKTIAF